MHRKGKGLTSKIHGGAMVRGTDAKMQSKPKHGRKNGGLFGRGRKVRKVGSGRM